MRRKRPKPRAVKCWSDWVAINLNWQNMNVCSLTLYMCVLSHCMLNRNYRRGGHTSGRYNRSLQWFVPLLFALCEESMMKLWINYSDIGGLEPIISALQESVIYPLVYPTLFKSSSSLLGAPKGVLLYGPPGCGKTMLAKALAKESGATFINIAMSVLSNKWYGESNKLVAGLFGLARKMQPSIIFIDEIDSFLRERSRGDHEVTAMMKAEFMT